MCTLTSGRIHPIMSHLTILQEQRPSAYAPPVLTATTYYRRNVTSGTCGTVASASVTITVYGNLTAGTIGTAQSICYNTAPAALDTAYCPRQVVQGHIPINGRAHRITQPGQISEEQQPSATLRPLLQQVHITGARLQAERAVQ